MAWFPCLSTPAAWAKNVKKPTTPEAATAQACAMLNTASPPPSHFGNFGRERARSGSESEAADSRGGRVKKALHRAVFIALSRQAARDRAPPPANMACDMNDVTKTGPSKAPRITLGFWVIKALATTLGETGGDAVTMSMNLGYAVGSSSSSPFSRSRSPRKCAPGRPSLHLLGHDRRDDDLGHDDGGFRRSLARRRLCRRIVGAVPWADRRPGRLALVGRLDLRRHDRHAKDRGFLLGGDFVSQTLGTALGMDGRHQRAWLRGRRGGVRRGSRDSRRRLFSHRPLARPVVSGGLRLTRPLAAMLGDLLDKPRAEGGLEIDRYVASGIFVALIVALILVSPQRAGGRPGES